MFGIDLATMGELTLLIALPATGWLMFMTCIPLLEKNNIHIQDYGRSVPLILKHFVCIFLLMLVTIGVMDVANKNPELWWANIRFVIFAMIGFGVMAYDMYARGQWTSDKTVVKRGLAICVATALVGMIPSTIPLINGTIANYLVNGTIANTTLSFTIPSNTLVLVISSVLTVVGINCCFGAKKKLNNETNPQNNTHSGGIA